MSHGSVAVLGLGTMGASLARALSDAGHDLVVWNRGVERRARFSARATLAHSALEACRAAETVIVCLHDHTSYMSVLSEDGVSTALRGKTVIQFTTDTPEEGESFGAWASERAIDVLEAAVLAYPRDIGTDRAMVVYAGPSVVYGRTAPIREALGGRSFDAGERLSAASVVDAAVLGLFYASAMSYLQGAELCSRNGVTVPLYSEVLRSWLPAVGEMIDSAVPMLIRNGFDGDQASLVLHRFGADHVRTAVTRAGLHTEFIDAIVEAMDRAIGRGHGSHELPALAAGLGT